MLPHGFHSKVRRALCPHRVLQSSPFLDAVISSDQVVSTYKPCSPLELFRIILTVMVLFTLR